MMSTYPTCTRILDAYDKCCIKSVPKYKRYYIIDQQIVQHFVHFSESLYHPLPFYATKWLPLFLFQGSEQITIKDCVFSQFNLTLIPF